MTYSAYTTAIIIIVLIIIIAAIIYYYNSSKDSNNNQKDNLISPSVCKKDDYSIKQTVDKLKDASKYVVKSITDYYSVLATKKSELDIISQNPNYEKILRDTRSTLNGLSEDASSIIDSINALGEINKNNQNIQNIQDIIKLYDKYKFYDTWDIPSLLKLRDAISASQTMFARMPKKIFGDLKTRNNLFNDTSKVFINVSDSVIKMKYSIRDLRCALREK